MGNQCCIIAVSLATSWESIIVAAFFQQRCIIGTSVNEPYTNESNWDFSYITIISIIASPTLVNRIGIFHVLLLLLLLLFPGVRPYVYSQRCNLTQ